MIFLHGREIQEIYPFEVYIMFCENLDREETDFGIPDFLADIYTLKRDSFCHQPDIESSHDPLLKYPDERNIIPITVSECKVKKIPLTTIELRGIGQRILSEEMVCMSCQNPAFFIRKTGKKWLCPLCAKSTMEDMGISTRPECCGYPSGCDSCGGVVNRMILIHAGKKTIFLCLRDECLMPFKYCLPNNNAAVCTCEIDSLSDLKAQNVIIDDLSGTIGNYLIKKYHASRKEMVLADLHMTRKDRCLPCQLAERYQVIDEESSNWEKVDGEKVTCSCSFSFLTSSYSNSCRKGSSLLSTPVSSPNCLRSQSSGDLTEEYTDSTSEI